MKLEWDQQWVCSSEDVQRFLETLDEYTIPLVKIVPDEDTGFIVLYPLGKKSEAK